MACSNPLRGCEDAGILSGSEPGGPTYYYSFRAFDYKEVCKKLTTRKSRVAKNIAPEVWGNMSELIATYFRTGIRWHPRLKLQLQSASVPDKL
ncbi:MAG: hypothetical protein HY846_06840 [Nitrosomonadales bacterium]|nr:hypothetical protein [Nitrosomonadales bacterium]